jgi:hypothetical protein
MEFDFPKNNLLYCLALIPVLRYIAGGKRGYIYEST